MTCPSLRRRRARRAVIRGLVLPLCGCVAFVLLLSLAGCDHARAGEAVQTIGLLCGALGVVAIVGRR